MGYGGTVLKYLFVTGFMIMIWALISWLASIIYSIPTGSVTIGSTTITLPAIQVDSSWYQWQSWVVWGWNLAPVLIMIGNALWLLARSQEKDVAEVQQPLW